MNIRCLLGRHKYVLAIDCAHLRHCASCDRSYISNSLARRYLIERWRKRDGWLTPMWVRVFLFRDDSWPCKANSVWRWLGAGEKKAWRDA